MRELDLGAQDVGLRGAAGGVAIGGGAGEAPNCPVRLTTIILAICERCLSMK